MVPEENEFVRFDVIESIGVPVGRRGTIGVDTKNFRRDPKPVKSVGNRENAERSEHQRQGVDSGQIIHHVRKWEAVAVLFSKPGWK